MEYLSHLAKINIEFILKEMHKKDPSNPYYMDLINEIEEAWKYQSNWLNITELNYFDLYHKVI